MKNMKKLTGICASVGEVEGKIKKYRPGVIYTKKDIVVLDEWVTKNLSFLKNVGGLLSSRGGLTCHASIIAREYGIPCLVNVKGADKLKNGTRVRIDAAAEELTIL